MSPTPQQQIVSQTADYVKQVLSDAESAHDWWHIHRVWQLAKTIQKSENPADLFTVELGALLHDIADAKFFNGDESIGPLKAQELLSSLSVEKQVINHVVQIIKNISFRKELEGSEFTSLELNIVQDADRLDAIGAIGIARAFNYGGFKGQSIYDPQLKPKTHLTKQEYQHGKTTTLNHFYEKLLLLKDKMKTETGKKLAQARHQFMQDYLDRFYQEWQGKV